MKSRFARIVSSVAVGLCLVALARPASAQYRPAPEGEPSLNALPAQLDDVGIEDKAGADVPRDVKLVHSDGTPFITGEYMDGDKPLIVVLAYFRCPMLCTLVINGLSDVMKGMGKSAGKDYRVLVVSFDPRDTPELANQKRENYVHTYGRDVDRAGYDFVTGDPAEVKRLADALGFRYKWDEKTDQFAHAAGMFVITPNAKVSQAITGIQFKSTEVTAALDDASRGVWHSPLKSALLYCFTYDPKKGSYVPVVRNVMKVGGALTLLGIGILLFRLFRSERSKPKKPGLAADSTDSDTDSQSDLGTASIRPDLAPRSGQREGTLETARAVSSVHPERAHS